MTDRQWLVFDQLLPAAANLGRLADDSRRVARHDANGGGQSQVGQAVTDFLKRLMCRIGE